MKSSKLFAVMCLLITSCAMTFVSCKEQIGLQGEPGQVGLQGPAGSTVLSGSTSPGSTTGNVGDFYLNLSTSRFYGPKKADGTWGEGFSMLGANGLTGPAGQNGAPGANGANGADGAAGANGKDGTKGINGAAGANGKDGNKILNGSGTPAADLGLVNDYYLDKDSYTLYGPKLGAGWGIGVSLKGTSDILYSGWTYAKAFSDTTVDNSAMKVGYITAKALSTSVLNSGTVLVYLTYGGSVFPLPYNSFAGGKNNTINYMPLFNRIVITRFTADNSKSVALSTLLQYRYVIIPSGKLVSSMPKKDLDNYELVKKTFNIPD
jgi:hypothetical protein